MSRTRIRVQFLSEDGKTTSKILPDDLGGEVAQLVKDYSKNNPGWLASRKAKLEHQWVFLEERFEYGSIGRIYQCKNCEGEIFSKGKGPPKKGKHFETRLRMNVAIGAKKLIGENCPGEPSFAHEQKTEALIDE